MTYKQAFLILISLQIIYFNQVLFKGEVIFPHNNSIEITGRNIDDSDEITNRKFSDLSSTFIPEINHNLQSKNRDWLATWNPYVQLGRPSLQIGGLGKASLITHFLSLFTSNPFILYTAQVMLTVLLTGAFCFFFLKTLGLHPLSCCITAIGLSCSVPFGYWLTFNVFLSGWCWTTGLLWLIAEFIKRQSYAVAIGISFVTYCFLMTAYPQTVVMHVYLIVGFALIYLWHSNNDLKSKFNIMFALIGAALIGAITASPAFLDLAINAQRSARLTITDEFFLEVLPTIKNLNDFGIFLSQLFDAFWFGNAIKPEYPFDFNGMSLTPLYFSLFLLSFIEGQWRRLWFWRLVSAACLLATLWSPMYLFMVHYLGFRFSRCLPLGAAIIPAFVLAGHALDHILRKGLKELAFPIILIMIPFLLTGITAFNQGILLHTGFILACLLFMSGIIIFMVTRKSALLLILAGGTVFVYSYSIMLTRPLSEIRLSSPLVESIRAETQDGSRYALVGQDLGALLPSNQEVLLKISSIHSYDSLSSVNYQRLALQLSETGATAYGRWFSRIDSGLKLSREAFSYTGVSLLLSRSDLDDNLFKKICEIDEIKFYKTLSAPILETQLMDFECDGMHKKMIVSGYLNDQQRLEIKKTLSFDDFMRFKVTPAEQETLLFVSQQYHPRWRASSRGISLTTVIINDFYLGAIIPPKVDEVDFEFRPFVRWSWIPQVLYSVLGIGLLISRSIYFFK